jgi:WD40 repeat protein/tRNA A-37 threonylcarbamoyl transferase component Bud32
MCEGCLVRVGLGIGATLDGEAGNQDIASIFDDLEAGERLPRQFGDYELLEEIGMGGMGIIYKAKHSLDGKILALKMIKAGELARREDVRRFKVEAEAAAKLRHPNIVTIHDTGERDGLPYFSMTYVGGPNLSQLVRMQPLPARRAATLLRKIAMAVQHAHDEGLLHRDLKPGNILIEAGDEPQVTDFGLARSIHSDSSLTRSGAVLGSPSYMSPEQAEGRIKDIDVRTDVHALGAVLYEMLTGRPPFQGESAVHTMRLVCQTDPAPPRLLNPDVPREMESVCLRCLEKQPARRYRSARDVAQEMEAFLEGRPVRARHVGPAGRLLRWCRRQPALAALSGALILALAGGIIGMALGWGEARRKAADERVARHAAEEGERRASLGVYNADMMMAAMAAAEPNRSRLIELLDTHDPAVNPKIPDLRSWEWYYLKQHLRGEELFTLGHHSAPVTAVAVSPDNKWAASADRSGILKVWNMERRAQVTEFASEGRRPARIVFSPDGTWMAAAWENGHTLLWRTSHWMAPALTWNRTKSNHLCFAPDSTSLYQTSGSGVTRYPLPREGEPFAPSELLFSLPPDWWVLPVYEPGSRRVALFNGALAYWDGDRREFTGPEWRPAGVDSFVTMLRADARNQFLTGWFNDELLYVFDSKTLRPLHRLRGHRYAVFDAAFSRDGKLLTSAGVDQTVQVWNLETGETIRRLSGHRESVLAVTLFANDEQILSGSFDGAILAWSVHPPPSVEGQLPRIKAVGGLSSDAGALAERIIDGPFTIRSILSGNLMVRLDSSTFQDTAVGSGGTLLGILHKDGGLEVQTRVDGSYLTKKRIDAGPEAGAGNITFSPGGELLLLQTGSTVIVYNSMTLDEQRRFSWKDARGAALFTAITRDGSRIAFSHEDHTVSVWNGITGTELGRFESDGSERVSVALSPDGRWLACSSFEGGGRLWDLSVSPPQLHFTSPSHDASWSVAFTPDGRRMILGLDDGDLAFWDTGTRTCVMKLRNQGVPAHQMLFDAADHALVVMTANRVTRHPVAAGFMQSFSASP